MFDDEVESEGWRQVSGPPPCCPGEPAGCEHERAVIAKLQAEYAEQLDPPDEMLHEVSGYGSLGSPTSVLQEAERTAGLSLAMTLEQLTLSGLDGAELVDAAAGWSRVAAWAEARRGEAAALLSEELHRLSGPIAEAVVAGAPAGSTPQRLAATELSMRLGVTRQLAERLVRTGRLLHGPLLATAEALERGQIDQRKAEVIAGALEDVPLPVALAVEDTVLPTAPRRTHPQVTHDVAKALIEADPEGAVARHRRARAKRRVNRPRALPDGLASISAVLPAEDAVALDLALDSAARTAKSNGDRRTLDQLRADALAAVGLTALRTGYLGRPPGCRCAVRPLAAAGSMPVPDTGAPRHDPDADGAAPPAPATGRASPAGASAGEPPSVLGVIGGEAVRVQVTVPLSTLLGGGAAGHLDGYGPIDPATARALALGGTWRRLVTDPLSGTVLDVGRSRYRPPPDLARIVRARDRTCVRPGCGARAAGCDLDHTIPFGAGRDGGSTALHNLGAQCRTDHLLKTNGDFRVRQLPGGVFEWTSRTGHTYRREADGTISHLGRTQPPQRRSAAQRTLRVTEACESTQPADLPSLLHQGRSDAVAGDTRKTPGPAGGSGAAGAGDCPF